MMFCIIDNFLFNCCRFQYDSSFAFFSSAGIHILTLTTFPVSFFFLLIIFLYKFSSCIEKHSVVAPSLVKCSMRTTLDEPPKATNRIVVCVVTSQKADTLCLSRFGAHLGTCCRVTLKWITYWFIDEICQDCNMVMICR